MKTPNLDDLGRRIKQLIATHMGQRRTATLQAVDLAFAVTSTHAKDSSSAPAEGGQQKHKMESRRSVEELPELSRKLYEQVCTAPRSNDGGPGHTDANISAHAALAHERSETWR